MQVQVELGMKGQSLRTVQKAEFCTKKQVVYAQTKIYAGNGFYDIKW